MLDKSPSQLPEDYPAQVDNRAGTMPRAAEKTRSLLKPRVSKIATAKSQSIQAFGKIKKPQIQDIGKSNLKRKLIEGTPISQIENVIEIKDSKKEKLDPAANAPILPSVAQQKPDGKLVGIGAKKRKASEEPEATPPPEQPGTVAKDVKRKKTAFQSEPLSNTPTRGARSLLERFALGASSASDRDLSPTPIKHEAPPSSPPLLPEQGPPNLPEQLQDLINLHSSFLTALSLYYAHNGLSNPADLRNLYPGIERTWKKRRVNIDDIRRILATGQNKDATKNLFFLSDYGHSKICVEVSDHALQTQRRIIDEEALNQAFTSSLTQKWSLFERTPTIGDPSPTAFLSHLPLLPITTSVSFADLQPLVAKGQQRLSDLKAGAIAAQSRNAIPFTNQNPIITITSTSTSTSNKSTAASTKSRATSLLDRLAAKAQQQSLLPNPPTPSQLFRKRALQRLPEIAPVLQSLAVGAQKHDNCDTAEYADSAAARERRPLLVQKQVSFTMATLVQVLQGSLRNSIAREEAVGCVRVMAEVVPEWVSVREVGRCVGVVVRGGGLGRGELEARVKGVLGEG